MKQNSRHSWLIICSLMLVWNTLLTSHAETPPPSQEARREASNQALSRTLQIASPAGGLILKLLRADQFAELDSILAEVESKYKEDIDYESAYVKAYDVIIVGMQMKGFIVHKGHDKDDLLAHLDKWVKDSPTNHRALCARGIHKVSLGWRERGTQPKSSTPEDQLVKMRQQFTEALQDLRNAVKLQPGLIPAYVNLIEISKHLESLEETTRWLKQAIQADPRTYYVREAYMRALEPKWQGSLEKMEQFGVQVAAEVAVNPRLWVLQGEVYVQRAALLRQQKVASEQTDKKFETAIEILSQAFEYGDRLAWLEERINLYLIVKDYQKALADIDRYLIYVPGDLKMRMLKQGIECKASNSKSGCSQAIGR